jgi:hypothetical protein
MHSLHRVIVIVLLLAVVCLSVAACGSTAPSSNPGGAPTPTSNGY